MRERGEVERWFLVHGESGARARLKEGLEARGARGVEAPERGGRVEI